MKRLRIDEPVKVILFIILISQLFFINGLFLFACILCFYIGVYYLHKPFKPTVFTIIFVYHFFQIMAGVWQATYLGVGINYRSGNMGLATIISLIGLLVLFTPIMYYQNKIQDFSIETLKKHADQFSIDKTFYVYLSSFFVSGALNSIRWLFPGYTQFIITLVLLKWFFFLLFGFQAILKNKRKKEFYFFIALEFILGFYSFFSDFKTVLFFFVVIFITLISRITLRNFLLGIVILIVAFTGATIWNTVKVDYRKFLNKGEESQTVDVSQNEALSKLYEITNAQGREISSSATESFLDRLQSTYHLAKSMEVVPDIIPYQNGKNWGEAFEFILTPRLFNPDKPQLDASVKASKYTGIHYAGASRGTSFSLGYFADCYIDFGIVGMMIPLFLIGWIYGITYTYFLRKSSPNLIFNYSIVCALYMRFVAFEMDNIFFIGGLFTDLLMYFLLLQFFFPWLYRFLSSSKRNDY